MNGNEMKPCPFCGGRAHISADKRGNTKWGFVTCGKCGARGKKKKYDEHSMESLCESVVGYWNMRMEEDDHE